MDLSTITLAEGQHDTRDEGMCLLEAVAWVAGEPHSDHPSCVDPVIGAFGRAWNDRAPETLRNELGRPLIEAIAGTAGSADLQDRRALMVADWCVRTVLPAWLDLTPSLASHARALRSLDELDTVEAVTAHPWAAAWAAAGDAAWDAAWDAARAAAGDAAWAAARAAARDAGAAARAAARDAARDAAGAAARAAALAAGDAGRAAARDALAPTVDMLQRSGADLMRRMCEAS